MKRIYLLLAIIITAFAFAVNLQAQTTDVTASYLLNTGFETNPTGAASDNYIYDVDGWTEYRPAGALNYYKLATVGYESVTSPLGTAPTNESSVTVDNATLLGVKLHWYPGDAVYVEQTATLPAGKYTLTWDSFVKQTVSNQASRMGYIVDEIATYDNLPSAVDTWKNHSLTFTLLAEKAVTFRFGYSKTANTGGTTSPILFVDNVKLVVFNVIDKSELLNQLNIAKDMAADPQPVGTSTAYAELDAAITSAQAIYDDPDATLVQVTEQEDALKVAIANVNSAIVIYGRVSTWTTLPYDITSLIVNPSFETGNTNGWTNTGGFWTQNNTAFTYKSGTYYAEVWKSGGNWENIKLSQKIVDLPNGIYQLTAAALNNPTTTGGAYIFANAEKAEVFSPENYSVIVTVTNNELEIGYDVVLGGNYIATDNFRLSYISDGSPYVVLAPDALFFDPNNLEKTFTVTGGNLTENLTLTAPTGISLDKYVLTPAEVAAGTTVTATFDNTTQISNGTINGISGTLSENITVNASADLACFTPLYSDRPNLIPNAFMNDISAFGGWGHKSVVLGEAYCGLGSVKFEATTNGWPDGAALDVNGVQWQPNSTYRLHAWVKSVDGTFAFFAQNTNSTVLISVPQSGDTWVEIDELFTTGASPSPGFFTFNNVDGASTGKIAYIDNYELYNVTDIVSGVKNTSSNEIKVFVQNNAIVADVNALTPGNAEISIYNVQGARIHTEYTTCSAGYNRLTVNRELPAGVYFVKLNIAGEVTTTKLVK